MGKWRVESRRAGFVGPGWNLDSAPGEGTLPAGHLRGKSNTLPLGPKRRQCDSSATSSGVISLDLQREHVGMGLGAYPAQVLSCSRFQRAL